MVLAAILLKNIPIPDFFVQFVTFLSGFGMVGPFENRTGHFLLLA
jgi:hypothetical protein